MKKHPEIGSHIFDMWAGLDVLEHSFFTNGVKFRFPELSVKLYMQNFALFLILMVPGRELSNTGLFFDFCDFC